MRAHTSNSPIRAHTRKWGAAEEGIGRASPRRMARDDAATSELFRRPCATRTPYTCEQTSIVFIRAILTYQDRRRPRSARNGRTRAHVAQPPRRATKPPPRPQAAFPHPEEKIRAETDVRDDSKREEASSRPRVSPVSTSSKSSCHSLKPEFPQIRAARRTPFPPARPSRSREPREGRSRRGEGAGGEGSAGWWRCEREMGEGTSCGCRGRLQVRVRVHS